jgi:glycosyltransferase involved in cell wall biosynthesis
MAKLLLTITAYPPSTGGAQLLMHQLARHLTPRHKVQVLTQWDTNRTDWLLGTTLNAPLGSCAYVQDGVDVQRISLPPERRRQLRPWVYAYHGLQSPALARIAAALAVEVEPWAADVDLIHNCRIGREGLSYASRQVAREKNIPFVFTPVHHPRWGTWLHRHYQALYRQADAVIALTMAERDMIVRLGVDERRVFVTGMGPVLAEAGDEARFRAAHGLGESPVVLFLGQKYAYKGVATVLHAATHVWRRCPEARFVFVGPRTAYSRSLFTNVTDRRIVELDTVNLQTKTDALAACQVLCVPSTQESFGGVYTEAWCLGKPVIGGDIAAIRSVIAEGEDGYVVAQQPGPVAERLLWLLERRDLAQAMGARGQAKVATRYTWPRLAALTEQVYQAVLTKSL